MNNKCTICQGPLDEAGKCHRCDIKPARRSGRKTFIFIAASMIIALAAGTFYFVDTTGGPANTSKRSTGIESYEVTKASEGLPIYREPKQGLTSEQFIQIRKYFESKQFGVLNTLFEQYQKEFENDVKSEYIIFDACLVFRTTLPNYEDIFKSWLQFSPDHFAPYLARAHYYYENGWESLEYRPPEGRSRVLDEKMRHFFVKAVNDVAKALELLPNLMPAYIIFYVALRTAGNQEDASRIMEIALELFPESYLIRATFMWAIKPLWGGSYEQMEISARDAEAYSAKNPELAVLYGFIYSDQAYTLRRKEKYEQAVALYSKALEFGDNFEFYYGRAEVYYYNLNEPQKALADIERVIALRPVENFGYILRSKILYKMENYDRALDDLKTAEQLKPADSKTAEWREEITKLKE